VLFHEKLRQLQKHQAWTENQLAEAAGLTQAAVHTYLGGRRMPLFPAAAKLARALDVSLDELADCDDVLPPAWKRK
jgi:transcriptional regulator with XRE-family HTH domain